MALQLLCPLLSAEEGDFQFARDSASSPAIASSQAAGPAAAARGTKQGTTPPAAPRETQVRPAARKTSPPRKHVPLKLDQSTAAIEKRLQSDVDYLASDELEGRGVRTQGLELAAEHIAKSFIQSGLVADHYGGPFHEFRLYSSNRRISVEAAEIASPELPKGQSLVKGKDFTSLSSSREGSLSAPLVFAGYGITAPEAGYDDYAAIDVTGKAVLVLRHEPQRFDANSKFDGVENSSHAFVHTKIKNAIAHGAIALVLCTDAAEARNLQSENGEQKKSTAARLDELLATELHNAELAGKLPVIHLRRSLVEHLFHQSFSEELSVVEARIDQTLQPESKALPETVFSGRMESHRGFRKLKNVVASLEGTGPHAEETVIVGAHYDHLGRDSWGSLAIESHGEIHHGADDNASGTAVVMEVARQLAARPEPFQRRVLFITFSAEELGLIGSENYVRDPLFPMNQTVAMLNLDMVGRLREGKLTIYGVETASNWRPLIDSTLSALPHPDELKLTLRSGGFGPSDHASFFEKGVPVLHFFTGFHPQYHRPEDVASLINPQGMRQIAELIATMVVQLANGDNIPQRRTSGLSLEELASGLDEDEDLDDSDQTPRQRRLGILIDGGRKGEGALIRQVVANSLAARNGLRTGDLILRINDQPVNSAAEIRAAIQQPNQAEKWIISLKRGDIQAEVIVKLSL